MKQFRIKRLHVLLVGLLLSAGVVVLFVFMFVKPMSKVIKTTNDQTEGLQPNIDKRGAYEDALVVAQAKKVETDARFDAVMHARMPTFPFKADDLASSYYMWDFAAQETALMTAWFARTGAQVSGYSFPGWPALTSPVTLNQPALPPLTWNLTVTVRDYADLQRWLLTIPKAPRFMVLQSVTIPSARGPGEPLVANVQVVAYEWLMGPGVGPAAVASAAASQSASGRRPGGGMGGMGGPGEGPGMTGGRGR